MEWLNYQHLLYFWAVARRGSVTRAAAELGLGQPTISAQLRSLEESLGEKLFRRVGRNLVLTDAGRDVLRYADEIFSLGQELLDTVRGRRKGSIRLAVGVADVVPKRIAYRLLQPVLALPEPVRVLCREDKAERLLMELAAHAFDLVLTDLPPAPTVKLKVFSHLLGECGVSFCASTKLAREYRHGFPRSLDAAPLLLPTENTALRGTLNRWLEEQAIRPRIVGEFEDSALLKAFGQAGVGIFPVPAAIEVDVRKQYGVALVGRVDELRERFYAVSLERRLKHPAVVAITHAARGKLFG
ncbi:MAG: Transcriptional regulator, LysR family [Deltaproteobacteria bacterium]|nr:Transcriptional regulator, LysR family [Deltaproteobacteria bacterium]